MEIAPQALSVALADYFNDPEVIGVELAKALQVVQARLLDDELDEQERVAKWMDAVCVTVINNTIERKVELWN